MFYINLPPNFCIHLQFLPIVVLSIVFVIIIPYLGFLSNMTPLPTNPDEGATFSSETQHVWERVVKDHPVMKKSRNDKGT